MVFPEIWTKECGAVAQLSEAGKRRRRKEIQTRSLMFIATLLAAAVTVIVVLLEHIGVVFDATMQEWHGFSTCDFPNAGYQEKKHTLLLLGVFFVVALLLKVPTPALDDQVPTFVLVEVPRLPVHGQSAQYLLVGDNTL